MSHPVFVRPELVVDNVTVTYNNGHTAIYDASFSLTGGTICALVGVNGSGKSTLFKSIMGLVKPSVGKVELSHKPISHALKQNTIAYVPQTEDVDWNFPVLVEDVVMMGRYGKMNFLRIPSREDKAIVNKSIERVGLTALRSRQIGELSGGQKNVFSWPEPLPNKAHSYYWMSHLPALTSKLKMPLLSYCNLYVTKAI